MSTHQTTPLRSSYEDLPSLAFSSSPLGDSPRTVHNRASRFLRFPQSSLPKPERLTDTLPSSPPTADYDNHFGRNVQVLGPSASLTEHKTPPKKFKNEASRRLSDILAATKVPALGKRNIDQVGIAEEYSIMGSDFGFLVDTSGHVRLSPLRRSSKKRMSLTREQILSLDSDSENEEPSDNVEFNAVGAFARILTRSRLDSAEQVSTVKPNESFDRSFFDPTATPRSQGSLLAAPSTPLSTANFQASIMTPPGAMFSFDHPMYSTGMTPYLPRS